MFRNIEGRKVIAKPMDAAHPDHEQLTEEDRRAVAASREWFEKNPEGISFERIVADCDLTMDDIKKNP